MFVQIRELSQSRQTDRGSVHILRGIDIDIERGSFTTIMGPSGSGKSTLLRCLAGIDTASLGTIVVGNTVVTGRGADERAILRRREFGFVFQDFELMPTLTAAENVELPLRLDSLRPDRAGTLRLLERVGLLDRAEHRPAELSGGQKQRVAIARALAIEPSVIFADEPTGALDASSARETMRLLRELADDGRTIVMVTHDPIAAAVSDSVLFLVDGRIVADMRSPTPSRVSDRLTMLSEVA